MGRRGHPAFANSVGGPVVLVLFHAVDAVDGKADGFVPDIESFIVVLVNRNADPVRIYPSRSMRNSQVQGITSVLK